MKRAFVAWPGWQFLRFAWLLSALNGLWFALVYGGSEWITAHRTLRVPIHFAFELAIPFVPVALLAYMSIYVLFAAGPFIVRERRRFIALISALAVATLMGGIGFLLLPSSAAFYPTGDVGAWNGLLRLADNLNLDYNMVPSLHVALSVCCIGSYAQHASAGIRMLLWTWAGAIAVSTVLTHQHHIIDAVSGWLVGIVALRFTAICAPEASQTNASLRCAG
jgi:hypothetical protein